MVEVLDQPPLPRRRQIKGCDQRSKQADVANADVRCGKSVDPGRLKPEREDFRIRGRDVGAAEGFDPGLQELGRPVTTMTEDRAEIAEAGSLAGVRRGEVVARDRYRQVWPQAELAALRVRGEIHPLADILARKIEKRLRRLQDRRLHARIAGTLVGGHE